MRGLRSDAEVGQVWRRDFVAWTESENVRKAHSERPSPEMFSGENVYEFYENIQTELIISASGGNNLFAFALPD